MSDDAELLATVHRLVDQVVGEAGSVPEVGSAAWWTAPRRAQVAGLLSLAERCLLTDPHRVAAEQLKAVSVAVSGGMDWSAYVWAHVPHAELMRWRYPLTGDPRLWVRYGPAGPPSEGVPT